MQNNNKSTTFAGNNIRKQSSSSSPSVCIDQATNQVLVIIAQHEVVEDMLLERYRAQILDQDLAPLLSNERPAVRSRREKSQVFAVVFKVRAPCS